MSTKRSRIQPSQVSISLQLPQLCKHLLLSNHHTSVLHTPDHRCQCPHHQTLIHDGRQHHERCLLILDSVGLVLLSLRETFPGPVPQLPTPTALINFLRPTASTSYTMTASMTLAASTITVTPASAATPVGATRARSTEALILVIASCSPHIPLFFNKIQLTIMLQ
jgi:hypothetical protein